MPNELIQGSPEWFGVRCGKVTASRVADIIRRTKTGFSTTRENYLGELIAEKLTGVPAPHFESGPMQWGTEQEPNAREAYQFETNCIVEPVGFVIHPSIRDSGASPDGYVGDEGLVEIKCPLTATHIKTLLTEKINPDYVTQMQWQMACTGRAWCDWVSFDPRMPKGSLQLFIQRVERDQDRIDELEAAVLGFLDELAKQLAQLIAYQQRQAA
jgi:putative phage-type endonuclease